MADKPLTLSARQARRIALHAQGLSRPRRHAEPGARQFRRLADDLAVIQIDSVNVLTRTHYLPAFSRLGAYPREALEREAWGAKPSLFEYWGHECSLLPMALQPLFRWRMERARGGDTWTGLARFARERRDYIDAVLARIEAEGPLTGGDFADGGPRKAGWWEWSNGKRALEWLFWSGLISTKTRRGFERVYDLAERVIPARVLNLPTPSEAEAHRQLLRIAAARLGVATEGDLRDYFRMPVAETKAALAALAEAGELTLVTVKGWGKAAWLAPEAKAARAGAEGVLLSPFDNLIWRRERAERLFGARIRLEIYTPAHKREHGYYVLPFLQGEAITARVDLKADRQARTLLVQSAHLEPGATRETVADSLAAELRLMSGWLGLGGVRVTGKGGLAGALASALG
ncbi:MAG TPA: crosslink repair DNA glycosylase YcaQ family protein [Caulobacteraceae bacterium]|nr:crosslink repair DNA glycosylase YcaQ family protein [Caulobacteraceae bacterium]